MNGKTKDLGTVRTYIKKDLVLQSLWEYLFTPEYAPQPERFRGVGLICHLPKSEHF